MVCLAFFVVNTGFVVNLHFCMDKLHSWQLGSDESEKCGQCGMDTGTSECCRDEVKVVKLQQDVVNANTIAAEFVSTPFLLSFVSSYILIPPQDGEPEAQIAYDPPLPDKHKSYIVNSVFRI